MSLGKLHDATWLWTGLTRESLADLRRQATATQFAAVALRDKVEAGRVVAQVDALDRAIALAFGEVPK